MRRIHGARARGEHPLRAAAQASKSFTASAARKEKDKVELALKNKVAIVSGSSDGMGRATADVLAAEGVNVAMCARTEKKLTAAAEDIRSRHKVEVFAQPLDVTDSDAVAK